MIGSQSTSSTSDHQVLAKNRPVRRGMQSGLSLLARGEPQIWFTGGMLALCLGMIVSLLALILYNGLTTFWPGKVAWLLLSDGSMDVGEPQRTESVASALRRNFRTGNFDVTGRHYRWFSTDELGALGIVYPEWLAIVERLEWGRLYGLPSRLVEMISPQDTTANDISEIQSSLELLSEAVAAGGENDRALAGVEQSLRRQASDILARSLRQLSQERHALGVVQWKVAGRDEWVDAASVDATAPVLEARELIDAESAIFQRLGQLLPELAGQRRSIDRLQQAISRLDQIIANRRIAIRSAELSSGVNALHLIESVDVLIEQQVGLAEKKAWLERTKELLRASLADDAAVALSATVLDKFSQQTLDQQAHELDEQFSQWREQFTDKPQSIQVAVDDYVRQWREVAASKISLQKEISRIEKNASRAEAIFSMPTPATALEALNADELNDLGSGKIPTKLVEQLKSQSLHPLADSLSAISLNAEVVLATFRDALRGRQSLWIKKSENGTGASLALCGEFVVPCRQIVRTFPANRLSLTGRLGVYVDRWKEFLLENPREANSEGGVFPAIWGTVVMTLIMTIAVVPFGVMAALYLREYTRGGVLVSMIRISINNLAGVPSIVYGVFGFAFFCYTIGAWVDGGPKNADIVPLPAPVWAMLMGSLALVGTASFLFSFLSSGPAHARTQRKIWFARLAAVGWLSCTLALIVLVLKSPYFDGFYAASLPNPTFGKGGLLWASLTLALLTLPVVIVATEEALSAVPNSLREGSLACGASKWQTIRRIVLPHARPGIMTGAILAMARGAGEVAPLMLVGALPTAPELPLDGEFPYIHGSRSFMHLGYQIYFLGFQSQNSDASKPMVFTCALLLILIIATLNISAIMLRSRLRRRFLGNQF